MKPSKQLSLHKETLRALAASEAQEIAGGLYFPYINLESIVQCGTQPRSQNTLCGSDVR